MVIATCKKCQLCQKAKLTNQKYGKFPAKLAKENPWDTPCAVLMGPYKIERKGKKYVVSDCDRPGNRLVRNGTNYKQDKKWTTMIPGPEC
jgi:hypothetical protein